MVSRMAQKAPDSVVFVEEFLRRVWVVPSRCPAQEYLCQLIQSLVQVADKVSCATRLERGVSEEASDVCLCLLVP